MLALTDFHRLWWSFFWRWNLYALTPFVLLGLWERYNPGYSYVINEVMNNHRILIWAITTGCMSAIALRQALAKHSMLSTVRKKSDN